MQEGQQHSQYRPPAAYSTTDDVGEELYDHRSEFQHERDMNNFQQDPNEPKGQVMLKSKTHSTVAFAFT